MYVILYSINRNLLFLFYDNIHFQRLWSRLAYCVRASYLYANLWAVGTSYLIFVHRRWSIFHRRINQPIDPCAAHYELSVEYTTERRVGLNVIILLLTIRLSSERRIIYIPDGVQHTENIIISIVVEPIDRLYDNIKNENAMENLMFFQNNRTIYVFSFVETSFFVSIWRRQIFLNILILQMYSR